MSISTFKIPSGIFDSIKLPDEGDHLAQLTKADIKDTVLTLTYEVNEDGNKRTVQDRLDFNDKNKQGQQMAVALKFINLLTALYGEKEAIKVRESGSLPLKKLNDGGTLWISIVHNKVGDRTYANIQQYDSAEDSDVASTTATF